MKKISPYITQDIQLDEIWMHGGFEKINEAGYYCVFWWKTIPLGDLYIEKGDALTHEVFLTRVFTAIQPTIDFYTRQQKITDTAFSLTFSQRDSSAFEAEMNRIFNEFLPAELPGFVDVSVVVCTRNRSVQLKNCLEQLARQQSAPAEIIIVDNAPIDESTKLVVQEYPGVTYLREPRPGLDIARNSGARLAKSSIVAYVDDDVLVHPLWVYRTWQSFSSGDVAATTGLVIASSLETEAQQIFEKFWSFNRGYKDKIYDKQFFDSNLKDGPPVWEIGAGANMAFRKSLFEQVGYFDDRLDVGAAGCSGDSEFWFRILATGSSILYSPRAVVYHEHRKELTKLHSQLFFYMRGFAAAALIQQEHFHQAGYKNRLFRQLPKNYLQTLISAFPRYSFQNRTLWSEIRGVISGILFYHKNKKKSPQ